ncbi:hypothetical protein K3725_21370 (plasmid) [Leisingera sp. S132]|uniref:FHA domain-containing protein n=1 Tax=Leisingera sp. S132 TaxID=2867016 RepID=UPI0021A57396|nr:FHA domain-containing protein [Leisingera sp. S132]UWQ81780.1 hypothetical protein K3725_21370 [Leisingera sp. S132]
MLIIKIISEELEDRFVSLGEGVHAVGSSISSDIVLLEEQIDPLHFLIKVSPHGVEVEMSPDSSGHFQSSGEPAGRPAAPGSVLQWGWGDSLTIGGTQIKMQGEMLSSPTASLPQPEPAGKPAQGWRIKLAGSVAIGLMAGVLLLTQVGAVETELPGIGSREASETASHAKALDPILAAQTTIPDRQEILAGLEALGLQVTGLARSGDAWTGVLRVPDRAEQERIEASLSGLAPHFSPRFFADDRLAEAAEVVVESLALGATIETVAEGVVSVSRMTADAPKAQMLRTSLLADVPGLKSVVFDSRLQETAAMVESKIAGTWAGDFPYVLLEDGKTVRPGETIGKDAKLIHVHQKSIVIEISGSRQKVELQ